MRRPPVTLKNFDLETNPEASSQARAIRDELDQVESLLKSLTPKAGRTSAASVGKPRGLTPETEVVGRRTCNPDVTGSNPAPCH